MGVQFPRICENYPPLVWLIFAPEPDTAGTPRSESQVMGGVEVMGQKWMGMSGVFLLPSPGSHLWNPQKSPHDVQSPPTCFLSKKTPSASHSPSDCSTHDHRAVTVLQRLLPRVAAQPQLSFLSSVFGCPELWLGLEETRLQLRHTHDTATSPRV